MSDRPNILILCTRNSARSQIAEVLFRKHVGNRFNVFSAGLEPDRVHPLVFEVLAEVGLDPGPLNSKSIQEFLGRMVAHYLVIVCENAEKNCPTIFPGPGERLYWPLPDPAAAVGSREEKLAAFRAVRDEIDQRVRQWLNSLPKEGE